MPADYYRRDQRDGISPPDPSKDCSFAEHVVRARGKRTQFTSVSLDLRRIRDFGEASYLLIRDVAINDGHSIVEHASLINELRRVARDGAKAERLLATQAIRYATRRQEGLVAWSFETTTVPRKDLIAWAEKQVQPYFKRI